MDMFVKRGVGVDSPILCLKGRDCETGKPGPGKVTMKDGTPMWVEKTTVEREVNCWWCRDFLTSGEFTWIRVNLWGRTDSAGTFTLDPRASW